MQVIKTRNIAVITRALVAGLAGTYLIVGAQAGPVNDQVNVELPYSVTVGGKVLQPGQYEIKELNTAGKSPVLQIFTNDGMKLETSVMTVPALENKTPEQTEVILHHIGDDYYFDKIWIQGKDYGYEFVLPGNVRAREHELARVSVPAAYQAAPTENPSTVNKESAAVTPPPDTGAPAAETPAPAPSTPAPELAQTQPPQEPQSAGVASNPTPDSASIPDSDASEAGSRNRKMPDTASNWLLWVLSGAGLSGAGIMLARRKRAA